MATLPILMPLSLVQSMIATPLLALLMMLPPKMVQPGPAYDGAIFDGATLPTLVENVSDMSAGPQPRFCQYVG